MNDLLVNYLTHIYVQYTGLMPTIKTENKKIQTFNRRLAVKPFVYIHTNTR